MILVILLRWSFSPNCRRALVHSQIVVVGTGPIISSHGYFLNGTLTVFDCYTHVAMYNISMHKKMTDSFEAYAQGTYGASNSRTCKCRTADVVIVCGRNLVVATRAAAIDIALGALVCRAAHRKEAT